MTRKEFEIARQLFEELDMIVSYIDKIDKGGIEGVTIAVPYINDIFADRDSEEEWEALLVKKVTEAVIDFLKERKKELTSIIDEL